MMQVKKEMAEKISKNLLDSKSAASSEGVKSLFKEQTEESEEVKMEVAVAVDDALAGDSVVDDAVAGDSVVVTRDGIVAARDDAAAGDSVVVTENGVEEIDIKVERKEEIMDATDELISNFIKIFKLGEMEKTVKMVVVPGEEVKISFKTDDNTRASLVGKRRYTKKTNPDVPNANVGSLKEFFATGLAKGRK